MSKRCDAFFLFEMDLLSTLALVRANRAKVDDVANYTELKKV